MLQGEQYLVPSYPIVGGHLCSFQTTGEICKFGFGGELSLKKLGVFTAYATEVSFYQYINETQSSTGSEMIYLSIYNLNINKNNFTET